MTTSGLRIEMELDQYNALLALIRDLACALNCWADSKDDPELDALLARARAVTAPARGGEGR